MAVGVPPFSSHSCIVPEMEQFINGYLLHSLVEDLKLH